MCTRGSKSSVTKMYHIIKLSKARIATNENSTHRGSLSRKSLSSSQQKGQQYTKSMKMSIKPRTVPGKDIELRTLSLYENFRRRARTPYQVHTNSKPKDIGGVIKTHIAINERTKPIEAIYSLKKSERLGSYPVVHPAFKASSSINGTGGVPQSGIRHV